MGVMMIFWVKKEDKKSKEFVKKFEKVGEFFVVGLKKGVKKGGKKKVKFVIMDSKGDMVCYFSCDFKLGMNCFVWLLN